MFYIKDELLGKLPPRFVPDGYSDDTYTATFTDWGDDECQIMLTQSGPAISTDGKLYVALSTRLIAWLAELYPLGADDTVEKMWEEKQRRQND